MSLATEREQARRALAKKRLQEKRMTAVLTLMLMVACGLLGYLAANHMPVSSQASLVDEHGNATAIRTIRAAGELCQTQATLNYGDELVRALVDDFSTRYDQPRDLFVVLLLTTVEAERVGLKDYRVHCHVVPEDTKVNYFRGFEV